MKKHKYKIGDIVIVRYINQLDRVAIIIDKSEMKMKNLEYNTYQIMICGITEGPIWFFEPLILEKL
jgi:hypothetical protein